MRRRLLAAVGAWAIGTGLVVADAPAAPPTPETLVGQLGADRFADREAAARALEARGEAAIPALRAAAAHPDPEVRRRAAAIVTRLQRSSESAKRLVPRTVALDYVELPLGTALSRLKSQTGVNLALDPNRVADPLRPITVRTGELPAWEAIEAFCRAAGLRETFTAEIDLPRTDRPRSRNYAQPVTPPPQVGNVPVVLVDGKADPLPGDRSTKLRVLALPGSFPANRVFLGTGEVVLSFDITPLPDLHWQDVVGVRVTRVVDDAGRPGSSAVAREAPAGNGVSDFAVFVNPRIAMRWDFDGNPIPPAWHTNPRVVPVPVRVATPGARRLRHLEGVVVGDVAVHNQELLTLADPVGRPGAVVEGPGGLKLSMLDVKRNEKDKSVVVRVQLEGPSAMVLHRRARFNPWGPFWPEPPRGPNAGNELRALDAAGKAVGGTMNLATDISDDGETLTQIFQMTFRNGPPAKFVVVGPRLVTVEVPFKMEDVPLP
jgi:hypothetical protein